MSARASRFVAATLAVLSCTSALSAELSSQDQAKLIKNVDAYAARMSEVALQIWSAPELGYMETKTSALLQDELKAAGFRIETGVAGIPTAFIARGGSNEGPVIAILAEMDSLPGLAQAAEAERRPIADHASRHACGHHLFGSAAGAAALPVEESLDHTTTSAQDG